MFTWLASSCYCPLILFSDQPPNGSFILIINILSSFLVFGIDWFQEIWCCFRYRTSSTRFPSLFCLFSTVKKLICVDKLFFFVPQVFHCEWWYCLNNVRLSVGISVLTLYKLLKGPLCLSVNFKMAAVPWNECNHRFKPIHPTVNHFYNDRKIVAFLTGSGS